MPGPKPLLASPAMAKQVRPYDATRMPPVIFYNGPWPFRQRELFPLGQRHLPFALRKLAPR